MEASPIALPQYLAGDTKPREQSLEKKVEEALGLACLKQACI